jgi:hypothetical protein
MRAAFWAGLRPPKRKVIGGNLRGFTVRWLKTLTVVDLLIYGTWMSSRLGDLACFAAHRVEGVTSPLVVSVQATARVGDHAEGAIV